MSRDCQELQSQLTAFIDPEDAEEPDEPRIAELRRHLAGCPDCQREVEELRALLETVQELSHVFPAHDRLEALARGQESRHQEFLRFLEEERPYSVSGWQQRFRALSHPVRLRLLRQVVSTVLLGTAPGELSFLAAAWDSLAARNYSPVRSGYDDSNDDPEEPSVLFPLVELALAVEREIETGRTSSASGTLETPVLADAIREQFWVELQRQTEQLVE